MEEQPNPNHTTNNEHDHHEPAPRIYVASLADYNAGRLHGTWIDAADTTDAIHEQTADMLRDSTEPVAEDWAIHDFEGFGPWRPSEHEDIEAVARVANGIQEHGYAFAHLADEIGTVDDVLNRFDDVYLGTWPSLVDYAQEVLDDLIDLDQIAPASVRPYLRLDAEALARDLATELHVSTTSDGSVHIFHP